MNSLRYIGSFAVAIVIVITMLIGGLAAFGKFEIDEREKKVYRVDLLSKIDRVDLAEVLGEDTRRRLPDMPRLEDIEPLRLPRRGKTGFVEVGFSVEPDGSVADIRILSNTHEGTYEDEARALVRGRSYSPEVIDGEAVASERIEIIDYSIAAPPD